MNRHRLVIQDLFNGCSHAHARVRTLQATVCLRPVPLYLYTVFIPYLQTIRWSKSILDHSNTCCKRLGLSIDGRAKGVRDHSSIWCMHAIRSVPIIDFAHGRDYELRKIIRNFRITSSRTTRTMNPTYGYISTDYDTFNRRSRLPCNRCERFCRLDEAKSLWKRNIKCLPSRAIELSAKMV